MTVNIKCSAKFLAIANHSFIRPVLEETKLIIIFQLVPMNKYLLFFLLYSRCYIQPQDTTAGNTEKRTLGPGGSSGTAWRKVAMEVTDFDNSWMALSLPHSRQRPAETSFIDLMVEVLVYAQTKVRFDILVLKLLVKFYDTLISNWMLGYLFPSCVIDVSGLRIFK